MPKTCFTMKEAALDVCYSAKEKGEIEVEQWREKWKSEIPVQVLNLVWTERNSKGSFV